MNRGPVSQFIEHHYRHFNAATVIDASKAYEKHLAEGGKMMITLAGAMSTAELGISLAEMIRQDKVQIISCTGANLEEDIMNLVAHSHYKRVPNYRDLTPQQEYELLEKGMNRVTDTCIPEEEAFRRIQHHIEKIWKDAQAKGERYFPHEFMYKLLLSKAMEKDYEIDPKHSWMLAAAEKNLPIIVPGWEDSTMEYFRVLLYQRRTASFDHENRNRIHDVPFRLVPRKFIRKGSRFLSDWRRHSRRFSNLCCSYDVSGFGMARCSFLVLFLSDKRFNYFVWLLFRSCSQRKNYMG